MIAFFDLDGTLLPPPSSERRLLLRLMRDGIVTPSRLARGFAAVLGQKLKGDRWAQQRNKDYLAGLSIAGLAEVAATLADELAADLRPEVLADLRAHAARGDTVVLLTGTPDFLAVPLVRHIGPCVVCATRCASSDGVLLARPPLRHPFGRAKLSLAREFAEARGTALADCWAYADSHHDLALLTAVGRAVAVHPDADLRREAVRRCWRIVGEERPFRARMAPVGGA